MNKGVRRITDGAMILAIIGVYLVVNRQFGGLLEVFLFVLPLPMVFYGVKYGFKSGLVVYFASLILSFILGGVTSLFYIASEGLCGLIYGSKVKDNASTFQLLSVTILIGIVVNLLTTVVFASVFGYDLSADKVMIQTLVDGVMPMEVKSMLNFENFFWQIIILSAIVAGIMEGLIVHLLSVILLKRLRMPLPRKSSFSFKFPVWSGYVAFIIFMGCNYLIMHPSDIVSKYYSIIMVAFFLADYFLLIAGSVAIVLLSRKYFAQSRFMGIVLVVLLAIVFHFGIIILGFIYITTNMYERIVNNVTKSR